MHLFELVRFVAARQLMLLSKGVTPGEQPEGGLAYPRRQGELVPQPDFTPGSKCLAKRGEDNGNNT